MCISTGEARHPEVRAEDGLLARELGCRGRGAPVQESRAQRARLLPGSRVALPLTLLQLALLHGKARARGHWPPHAAFPGPTEPFPAS